MAEVQIKRVDFLQDFKLDILLSNGHRIIYDCGPKLKTARFKDIEEWEKFRRGRIVDGKVMRWDTGNELSLDEVMYSIR